MFATLRDIGGLGVASYMLSLAFAHQGPIATPLDLLSAGGAVAEVLIRDGVLRGPSERSRWADVNAGFANHAYVLVMAGLVLKDALAHGDPNMAVISLAVLGASALELVVDQGRAKGD